MPELDFDNEDVRAEVVAIAKHYLDLCIDGFRFDAAKYIYFGDNAKSVEFWKWYMAQLRAISPDIYAVGEVWDGDGITDMYYPALNCFNFTTSQTSGLICETAKYGDANKFTSYVQSYVERVGKMNDGAMILQFIANHDTDRAAGYLTVSSGQMQMAANVYLLSSGSPFIYYGEELGMRGSRGGAQTDANRRLAMIWGDGDTVKDPTGSTYPASTQTDQTAQIQKADGESLYSYYKKLIMIRKANPEICRGEYKALKFDGTKLGGFTSTLDGKTVCVIHNTTKSEITIDLSLATSEEFEKIAAVIGVTSVEYDEYGAIESQREAYATLDGTKLTISAQTSVVLR
jgi:glycosidase